MFINVLSAIGAVTAVAVLLLMSASSVLPDALDRLSPARRRAADDSAQRSQVSPHRTLVPDDGGLCSTARHTGGGPARGTGSRGVFPTIRAGPLP
ncbi:hypothetical protein BJ970_001938 [Saccharopolyspora phatthalungensis]|uniref:Uncharacterized protein n=1 Tax=Saccharopolyspora phatthalungensis TaxID=664693 RepID=A0A840Q1X0_9PSEU|nr:hypothetical protein [Saccharopolyspora phatthalungensis]